MNKIIVGDCRIVMATLPEASVDAIVTDPPYELGFMGRAWDKAGVAFDPETWRQALRVLKPGGHLLAFGGTRTYHRMVVAIEDAGFEIRDQIGWTYGSGFPKSLDVSKAIDKAGGASPREQSELLRRKREARGLSRERVAEVVGCTVSSVRDWEEGRARSVGAPVEYIVPSKEYRAKLSDLLGYSADERRLIGASADRREDGTVYGIGHSGERRSGGHSDAASQWQGWGTALKPAYEPVVVAQKPLTLIQLIESIGELLCKVDSLAATDMSLCAPLQTCGFWNTAQSLNECLGVLYATASMFTTETAIALTTDLRTLKCCLSQITRGITTQAGMRGDGITSSASLAAALSQSVRAKCERLRPTSAGGVAIDWLAGEATGPAGNRLSPEWQSICVARKSLIGTVAENVLQHGTGALNIDGCRVPGLVTSNPMARGAGAISTSGHKGQEDTGLERVSDLGRWPANLIHDGSDEVVALFPWSIDGVAVGGRGKASSIFGTKLERDGGEDHGYGGRGSAARFFYSPKASKKDRGEGNTHPTVKPIELMRYLCRLVTPPGGTVLDPFAGSGSTLKAAELEGFSVIGIELLSEHVDIVKRRCSAALDDCSDLFADDCSDLFA